MAPPTSYLTGYYDRHKSLQALLLNPVYSNQKHAELTQLTRKRAKFHPPFDDEIAQKTSQISPDMMSEIKEKKYLKGQYQVQKNMA